MGINNVKIDVWKKIKNEIIKDVVEVYIYCLIAKKLKNSTQRKLKQSFLLFFR